MVQYTDDALDEIFSALADRTRRGIIEALDGGSLPVSALAAPHGMSLTGFMKHLRVLEDARLITRSKAGRVVNCTLSMESIKEAAAWMARYEKFWNRRLDALGRYLYQQEELTPWPAKSKTNHPSPSRATIPSRPKKSGTRGRTRKP
ncbi:MAG TPA: metalloregulator ArsR/SmtB family transcription factor [Burkholderiales bacterium]|nr:metalloregulator ArsR/SmtB family transcription factor [Burkholderiales bacterium]